MITLQMRPLHFWPVALIVVTVGCGVGGTGQVTAGSGPQTQTVSQGSTPSGNTTGGYGNTTGATDPGTTPDTTAGATTTAGTDTAGSATGAGTLTAGETTGAVTGSTTATTAGATTGADPNGATGQNGNQTLFDLSDVTQPCCLYDAQKKVFMLSLSNDASFCAHNAQGARIKQEHSLALSGDLTASTAVAGDANNPNAPTLAQPKNVTGTLALYNSSCALQAQAKSLSASVTFSQASSLGCTGTFTVMMNQTTPATISLPQTLSGSFTATSCPTLSAGVAKPTCQ